MSAPNRDVRIKLRQVRTAATILRERLRAQTVRLFYPSVRVHPSARLGRGTQVTVGQGGTLELGPGSVGRNTVIQVGKGATVRLLGRYIGPNCVIVARHSIEIAEGVMVAEMCIIRDSDHDRDDEGRVSDRHHSSPVRVEADAWLASRATVLKGVTVGASATVGAAAVVTKDVPPRSTVVGVPAHRVR